MFLDHPRVCGEKDKAAEKAQHLRGSPPRVRGKEKGRRDGCDHQRITPACAGKRRSDWIIRSIYWDHPRVCGEKLAAKAGSINGMGSPPRMRGKGNFHVVTHTKVGITPACAGKREVSTSTLLHLRDHPRMCGEKKTYEQVKSLPEGSPPHMRGKAYSKVKPDEYMGITPAYAGKSKCKCGWYVPYQDHPRVCGEKKKGRKTQARPTGSPPRMRGKAGRCV